MRKFKDLTGQKFGKLTVISREKNDKHGNIRWLCKCDCGKETTVQGGHLTSGRTKSCGCVRNHGQSRTRLYRIWVAIKTRCYNPAHNNYKNYGGRGIVMCYSIKDNFTAFREWALTNGYKKGLTIDRVDVNGNYTLDNMRWATMSEQARNKRNTIYFEGQPLIEVVKSANVCYSVLTKRLKNNPDITYEELINPIPTELQKRKKVFFNSQHLTEIAAETGIKYLTLWWRLRKIPDITYEQLTRPSRQLAKV